MKAADYAKRIIDGDMTDEVIVDVCNDMVIECQDIIDKRNAKMIPALRAVYEEQNLKWNAVSRLTGGYLKPNMFYEFIRLRSQPMYDILTKHVGIDVS